MNTVADQQDIFSDKRADLLERIAMIGGMSTWREPTGGFSTKLDRIPYANILASALVWWCNHSDTYDSISGHILESLALQRVTHQDDILTAMVRALADMSSKLVIVDRQLLRKASYRVLMQCVYGIQAKRVPSMGAREWVIVDALGTAMLWRAADEGLSRAYAALR